MTVDRFCCISRGTGLSSVDDMIFIGYSEPSIVTHFDRSLMNSISAFHRIVFVETGRKIVRFVNPPTQAFDTNRGISARC